MFVSIYQINTDLDQDRNLKFRASADTWPDGIVDAMIYDRVYYGEIPGETLHNVYEVCNLAHPEGYRGHSLSVSDIVLVHESENVNPGAYYVEPIGFRPVTFTGITRIDGLFYEMPLGEALTADILLEVMCYMPQGPYLPVEIDNPCGTSSAMGFIRLSNATEAEEEIKKEVAGILNDMELEKPSGMYKTRSGYSFKLIRR